MKLITCEIDSKECVAVLSEDRVFPLTAIGILPDYDLLGHSFSMTDVIRMWDDDFAKRVADAVKAASEAASDGQTSSFIPLSDVKLLSPIPRPEQDIVCLGLNYSEHAVEAKEFNSTFEAEKAAAVYFSKRATYSQGTDAPIPAHTNLTNQLDYEVELAVIIGKDAYQVSEEDAENYIFGYSVFNDVSAREVQTGHKQWYFGKSLDGFSPMGPCIVTRDEFAYPPALAIKSFVNGELRQDSTTDHLIHDISEIISELSSGMLLKAGTIIATGTPAGVGMGMNPPTFLKPGDEVVCYIEGIGELKNTIE